MDSRVRTPARAAEGEEGDGATAADLELARRVVGWLTEDEEGRSILRALARHPRVGAPALKRRLGGADPSPLPSPALPERVLTGRRVERAAAARPHAWEEPDQPPGLARQLSLAGAGLLAGGFAAFMLGVFTLGRADPGFPPLSVFGAALMLLSALPPVAAGVLRRRHPGTAHPAGGRGPLITFAVATAAIAVAAAVAALTGR